MLHWNDLHPYNAVLVVRLPGALERVRLQAAIEATLSAHGLTGLVLNRRAGTFEYHGGPATADIKPVNAGENSSAALDAEIEAQLNTSFAGAGAFNPFRFFVLPEPTGFALGVVYFHAVADAEAVIHLTGEIAAAYLHATPPGKPFAVHPQRHVGWRRQLPVLMRKLAALPAQIREMRSSARLFCGDENDFSNRFTSFALADGELAALVRTAKNWDVTVNDLFLALLLKCLARLQPGRRGRSQRRNISVGCIVNLRQDLAPSPARVFSPQLGSFVVTHEMPADASLRQIAGDIRERTRAIKRHRLYLAAGLEQIFGRWLFSFFPANRQQTFYQKHFPLWGGLTNVNLNAFPALVREILADGFSAVSTGPVVPLVLSVMSVRATVNVALTGRPAFFSETELAQFQKDFRQLLAELKSGAEKSAAPEIFAVG